MNNEISLVAFASNLGLVNMYMTQAVDKNVTHIEYRATGEDCDASFFVMDKGLARDRFEAFVTLYTHVEHFHQEWYLAETDGEVADQIIKNWMLPELETFSFQTLTVEKIEESLDYVMAVLGYDALSKEQIRDETGWRGVYVNGERVATDTSPADLGMRKVSKGVAFLVAWNDVVIFFETPADYVYLWWGTSA